MIVKYEHQLTCAYQAGIICGYLYNYYYKRNDLPSIILCMRDFMQLKQIFGKYYTLLKNNKKIYNHILQYEKFVSKLNITKEETGGYIEFMIGFSEKIKKHKLDIPIHSSYTN